MQKQGFRAMGRQGSAASTDTGAHLRSTASDSPHVTAQQAQLDEQQEDADGFYQYLCQQAVVSAAAAHMPYTAASPGQHHPPQLPAHLHAPPNNLQTSSCMTSTTAAPPPAATTTPHNATANIPTASTTTTSSTSSSSGVPVLIVQAPHCPSALARPAWSVSQFELRSTQYEGGHSIVWRAVDRRSGITLALKAYKRAGLNEIERHQVAREIWLHAQLCHPAVISLYAAWKEGPYIYIALEWADEGSVYCFLASRGGLLDERSAVRLIAEPLTSALAHLHAQGIIHRDIKPENVLLDRRLAIKVADFGLSIHQAYEVANTRLGTIEYLAPEVIDCPLKDHPMDNKQSPNMWYTAKVDVWSLGVMVYEMLLGRLPFTGHTPTQTLINIRCLPLVLPLAHNTPGGISVGAADFIARALTRDPAARPSMEQLLQHPWLRAYTQAGARGQAAAGAGALTAQQRQQHSPMAAAAGVQAGIECGQQQQPPCPSPLGLHVFHAGSTANLDIISSCVPAGMDVCSMDNRHMLPPISVWHGEEPQPPVSARHKRWSMDCGHAARGGGGTAADMLAADADTLAACQQAPRTPRRGPLLAASLAEVQAHMRSAAAAAAAAGEAPHAATCHVAVAAQGLGQQVWPMGPWKQPDMSVQVQGKAGEGSHCMGLSDADFHAEQHAYMQRPGKQKTPQLAAAEPGQDVSAWAGVQHGASPMHRAARRPRLSEPNAPMQAAMQAWAGRVQ